MNWIDKTIAFFSPSWGYRRVAWRNALRGFYDSGGMDRLNSGWTAVNVTAEQSDQGQRDVIRARSRDLERNSDIAEAIIGPYERNVVGTGIKVQAKIIKDDGKEDDGLNQKIEDLFKEWCRPRNCDITGQQSFQEMQAMAERRLLVDGGIIFQKVYTNEGIVPFSLQAREVDDLDSSFNSLPGVNKNRVAGGIEFNQYNKPVAYYLKKFTPDGYWTGQSERIAAKDIIFLWKKNRPTQIREMSPLAKTLPRVRDINEFVEAISVKERILACLAVFITKINPSGSLGRGIKTDPDSGYKERTISPGMIQELQPGEAIASVNPSGQSSNAREFISSQQRLAGSGQGLSYEAVSRDMSQVNYSSARQGLLEDQRTYTMAQQFLIEHFCHEVYTEFVISAVISGKINIPDFWSNKLKYLKHEWIAPGWSWIDPLKEVKANDTAIKSGMDTLARICAERGMDWKDVLKQRAREIEFANSLGISMVGGEINDEADETTGGDAADEDDSGTDTGS
ncbi:phage portal protein, lambda family [Oxobacter pfennigii]|uniref:Phage portal protein, lambda family n=1 Tax=Oxobacter pfennigii TaxID=36849 RepID=A0A0P8YRG7_9CLOT|nr:phage portal protein [Oxobacter pfennigii]KPU42167.1 phage portal protein, lambda family [Oxobacter pfennigii]